MLRNQQNKTFISHQANESHEINKNVRKMTFLDDRAAEDKERCQRYGTCQIVNI